MPHDLPFYQEAQLKNLLEDIRAMARQKRLEAIFDIELFSIERNVEAVLAAPTPDTAQAALREARDLLQRLKDAPDKSNDGLLLR